MVRSIVMTLPQSIQQTFDLVFLFDGVSVSQKTASPLSENCFGWCDDRTVTVFLQCE